MRRSASQRTQLVSAQPSAAAAPCYATAAEREPWLCSSAVEGRKMTDTSVCPFSMSVSPALAVTQLDEVPMCSSLLFKCLSAWNKQDTHIYLFTNFLYAVEHIWSWRLECLEVSEDITKHCSSHPVLLWKSGLIYSWLNRKLSKQKPWTLPS